MTRLLVAAACALFTAAPAFAQSLDVPQDGATSPGFGSQATQETVIPAPQSQPAQPAEPLPQAESTSEKAKDVLRDVQETVVPTGKRYEAKPSMLSLQAGVGVTDFRGELANNIDTGVSWDLRGGYRNDKMVGGELAFTGSANDTASPDNDLGAAVNRVAVTNMGDAQARLNFTNDKAWQPYVAAGLGFLTLDVRDKDTTVEDGNAVTVPLSAGVQLYTKSRVTFGGRFNYRVLTDIATNDIPSGDEWNLGVNVGALF